MSYRGVDPKFTREMRRKLDVGRNKGRTDWDDRAWTVDNNFLKNQLMGEIDELLIAIGRKDRTAIQSECADVANFAMFIADYWREETK